MTDNMIPFEDVQQVINQRDEWYRKYATLSAELGQKWNRLPQLARAWDLGHTGCVCACHTFGTKGCRDCLNPYQEET